MSREWIRSRDLYLNLVNSIAAANNGNSLDWVHGELGVKLAFIYEHREEDADGNYYLFVPPTSEIEPNAEEILQSLIALTDKAEELGYIN